jgi:hypothetical protein
MHPTDELTEITRKFRHLQAEHEREGPEGSWRRRHHARLLELERHFETLLERWIEDREEREKWRAHLYHGAGKPDAAAPDVLLYKGRSPNGALIEIRVSKSGERAVAIDGARADHFAADLPMQSPLEFGGSLYEETFDAPGEAIEALGAYLRGAVREPPWRWATLLYADGIIDSTFALSERGRRLFERSAPLRSHHQ